MRTRHLLTGLVALTLIGTATVAIAAGDPPPRIAFVARSDNPADALAAGPIAGQLGAPLFTTPPTSLAPEAQAGLGAYGPDLVIITGGGQGIGRGYAHYFAAQGAIPVIAELNGEAGERVADEVRAKQVVNACGVFSDAIRRLSRVSLWYAWSPCEKLKRATRMPARSSASSLGTSLDTGPRVHTMLVRFLTAATPSTRACLPLMPMY